MQGYAAMQFSQTFGVPWVNRFPFGDEQTFHGACYHDCPDTCSWVVTAMDGKVTKFEASKDNPFTNGTLCQKMDHFPDDVTFHPDRILTPLKRVGKKGEGKFEQVSWGEAMKDVASRLKGVIASHGAEAVLPYSFAGTEGLIQKGIVSEWFFAQLGASRLARNICGDTAVAGIMATNGQTTGVLPEDIVHSSYIILWGTNPVVSNQHLWPLIRQAREKGARIVVIDPFVSQTAEQADLHIQPMPGTDTVLALSMAQVILAESLQDQDYIDRYTSGIKELKSHVQQYPPEEAAKITGVEAEVILNLAREYARAAPSLIRVLIGMEHQANGGSAFRAIAMLPALTGAWRVLGGGLMNMTYELFGQAMNWELFDLLGSITKNPEAREINMIRIGRALTDPEMDPPVKAMIVYNSNPAVIAPNQNLVIRGLAREDLFTVVLEHFMTDTARYADYIFPATSQLEHWDLMESWGQVYINLNEPAIPPLGEAKPNAEFFRILAGEMGISGRHWQFTDREIIENTLESKHPYLKGTSFKSLRKTGWAKLNLPQPWIPHAQGNFATENGKCLFHNPKLDPPVPVYNPVEYSEAERKSYPLHLLTVKSTKHFLNTSHANVGHLIKKEGRPFLDMHPEDARVRKIRDGEEVKVFNQRGEVLITARIKDKVRKGVVCMPQGFWPSLMKGGSSANALTDDRLTDLGDGAALQEARVEVVKV